MSSVRRLALCALLAGCALGGFVLGPCGPAAAEDPLAGPHALDDGIQALRARLDSGDCADAEAAVNTLLEAHKPKDYAKARRAEIEDLLVQLACCAKHGRPKAKDLVAGDLQSWSAKTGKIKIKLTPKRSGDLEERDGLLRFPARITGPFTLEIKGSKYPKDEAQLPRVVLGGDQDGETGRVQTWTVDYGAAKKSGSRGAAKVEVSIVPRDGDEEKKASRKKGSAPKPGKAYKVVVKGAKKKISAALGSRSLGSVKKPAKMYGYVAFRAGNWTEAKLSGTIDPSWIEGRIEERLRTQLLEFEEDYDPSEHLPDWLSRPLSKRSHGSKKPALDLVGNLDAKFTDLLQEYFNGMRLDEVDEAFKAIDTMQAQGAPEATCEYLRADGRMQLNQLERAIEHVQRCMELEPTYLDGVLLQGSLLRQLGRFDDALVAFEKAAAGGVQYLRVYEESAEAMLRAGRPEDAKRLTQLAARNGVTSEKLVTLNDALAKVVRGPRWRKRFEKKSRNYHVISNMDAEICAAASTLLEESFEAFRQTFGWVPEDKTRLFKVYIFDTQDGFMGYQGDLEEFMGKPNERAAGLFSPLLKQLLIWKQPNRREMMNTVRHEGFHQYLDRLMPSPPVWFNEGLAVYHENAEKVDGKLQFGRPQPMYVRLLLTKGLIPLEKFLYGGARQFYEDGHRSYGQAWLLVHMLKHTTPAYQALFKRLVKDLQTRSAFKVLQENFPPASIPQLKKDMKDYLDKLARD